MKNNCRIATSRRESYVWHFMLWMRDKPYFSLMCQRVRFNLTSLRLLRCFLAVDDDYTRVLDNERMRRLLLAVAGHDKVPTSWA